MRFLEFTAATSLYQTTQHYQQQALWLKPMEPYI
jgi:hypothetical protein